MLNWFLLFLICFIMIIFIILHFTAFFTVLCCLCLFYLLLGFCWCFMCAVGYLFVLYVLYIVFASLPLSSGMTFMRFRVMNLLNAGFDALGRLFPWFLCDVMLIITFFFVVLRYSFYLLICYGMILLFVACFCWFMLDFQHSNRIIC